MNFDFNDVGFVTVILHAVTAVGIIEWVKKIAPAKSKRWYAIFLPVAAAVVAVSTLYAPLMLGLRILAWSQLAYAFLVKLPERILNGKPTE